MTARQSGHWWGADFLFDSPNLNARTGTVAATRLFSARRYTLDVASLCRETVLAGAQRGARVRLSGLGAFCHEGLRIEGPGVEEAAHMQSLWIRIHPASDRTGCSMLDVSCLRQGEHTTLRPELVLYLEPARMGDLMQQLEFGRCQMRVHFTLESTDAIVLTSAEPRVSLPVYELAFQLQQPELSLRSPGGAMLPQLQLALARCVPEPLVGTTQLERIGREIAESLGHTLMGATHSFSKENAARRELTQTLAEIRSAFHGAPEGAGEEAQTLANAFGLELPDFEQAIAFRSADEKARLREAYGAVWLHGPLPASPRVIDPTESALAARYLTPNTDALAALARRYCAQRRIVSPTLEWYLIDALLRTEYLALAKRPAPLLPKLRDAGREAIIQTALAGGAWLLAQADKQVFWRVFLALNLIRWISPAMSPASGRTPTRAALLGGLAAAHKTLSCENFDAAHLRSQLLALQSQGAAIQPEIEQLLSTRLSRNAEREVS